MASGASHIRFALDLKNKYQVSDIEKYVSGSIYPDSRYVTKIDRNLTHPINFLEGAFPLSDDFRKGWFTHLLCDILQKQITEEKFPELFSKFGTELIHGNNLWINLTALKFVQDIYDLKEFDSKKYLSCLNYAENPNHEDLKKICEFNKIYQNMYKNSHNFSVTNSYEAALALGIDKELALKVKTQAEEFQQDPKMVKVILSIYPEMLQKAFNK